MVYKKFKFEKTSSQLKPVRNSYVAIMYQRVTVSSNKWLNACTNKAFSSTSTRFNPYSGLYKIYNDNASQSRD